MIQPVQRLYLDLDRTLFDTAKFIPALFDAAEKVYGVSAQELRRGMEIFSYSLGDMKTYNFFDQMAALGVGETRAKDDIGSALKGQDFLYPDTHRLLAFLAARQLDLHVLSFGKTNYQTFKYSLAQELRHIPITVVFEDKSSFLARQSNEPSLLVDDKIVAPLPEWCTQLFIQRTAPDALKQVDGQLWYINSLLSVQTMLSVGYNEPNQKGTSV